MRRILIFWIGISIFLYTFSFNIRIDIPKVKLKIEPGEVINGAITVENPSSEIAEVKVYVEDFLYVPPYDGSKEFFPPGTIGYSCAKWINFSPQKIILPPFAKRKVNYVIKVPPKVRGGYYAVMFFETSLGSMEKAEGVNVVILGRVGTLFFLETEDSVKEAEIENVRVSDTTIKGDFLNKGNVVITSKGSFYIMDSKGMVLDRGKLADFYLFPEDKGEFRLKIRKDIPPGRYTIVCSFDLGEGDILVRELDILKESLGSVRILSIRR